MKIIYKLKVANIFLKSGKRGSNPRPSAWEADALPTELLPLFDSTKLIESLTYYIRIGLFSNADATVSTLTKRQGPRPPDCERQDALPTELLPLFGCTKLIDCVNDKSFLYFYNLK